MRRMFARVDSGIAVMQFTHEDAKLQARDTQAYLDANPGATVLGDDMPFPANRRFRNAWSFVAGAIAVDLPKARVQRLAEIRAERDQLLVASDGSILRAQETQPVTVPAWLVYRQALRNLPAAVSTDLAAIATPDALAAYAPAWPALPDLA